MHLGNRYQVLGILVALLFSFRLDTGAEQLTGDHLVPAEIFFDPKDHAQTAYWKLIQEKLSFTPTEMVGLVQFPGATGVETVIAVHAASGKTGGYSVTVTQPSSSLWETVAHPGEKRASNSRVITVKRCDAPVPASTALALRQVWVTMLRKVKPEPKSESISVDSTIEIFTGVAPTGAVLHGQSPHELVKGGNISGLIGLANLLIHYCDVPEFQRAAMARKIEKDASDLLLRVTGKKNPNAG